METSTRGKSASSPRSNAEDLGDDVEPTTSPGGFGASTGETIKIETIRFNNGDVYEGEVAENGERHGKGVCRFVSGHVYDGEWKDDEMQGTGTIQYPDGDTYEGETKGGSRHGKGIIRYPDGSVYDGEWKDDKQHGRGTKTWPHGNTYTYEGEWAEGKMHGKGALKGGNVCIYEGELREGKRHGKGVFWDGHVIYDGEWKDNSYHGTGTITYENGVYKGEFNEGMMQGKGMLKWKNGNVYEGEWKGDQMHGVGTYTHFNNDVYVGEFQNGKKHGSGVYRCARGNVWEGTWTDGKRVYTLERKLRSQRSQQRRLERNAAAKKCEHCRADDVQYRLRMCSGCNLALYCSAACQTAASGSHRRICNIISELPPKDEDNLVLTYDREKMVDLDAGLRYATKYMSNLKHLTIDIREMRSGDTFNFFPKRLSSLLRSKKGALDSVFWLSNNYFQAPGFSHNLWQEAWKDMHSLKQLRLNYLQFDDIQPLHNVICQQSNTLKVLCLPFLDIGWHQAKCRRRVAQAVNSCKHLVKLDLGQCEMADSDLKIMLHDLPKLRVLDLAGYMNNKHEFTDNTCGLIARKCPGLQSLNLNYHNQLSVRGIRKIFEGCSHLRAFCTSSLKLSCKDILSLLDTAPQLLLVALDSSIKEIDEIIEATGGRTVIHLANVGIRLPDRLSAETDDRYCRQRAVFEKILRKREDHKVANEWEDMLES